MGRRGKLLHKKRKSRRPLDVKKSIHLELRLKERLPSFFNPRDKNLKTLFLKLALKNEIKIYNLIFNHTHCHAVIKIENRTEYISFIRELTSKLVSYFSRQTKIKLKKIFEARPWTRVIHWGRDFLKVKKYMNKNETESGVLQATSAVPKEAS